MYVREYASFHARSRFELRGGHQSHVVLREPFSVVVGGLAPMTALLTGTFLAPAVPFRDKDAFSEYQEMQDSYRSDAWQPPRLWRGKGPRKGDDR